jgi:hypothetical protein
VTQLNPSSAADPSAENVQRGLLFSLGAIALAIVAFGILSGVIGMYGWVTAIVALAVPLVGAWLYTKGAGTPPKLGRMKWIGIMVAAVIVGALTIFVASGWYLFSQYGKGGIVSPAFWSTVVRSAGEMDVLLPVFIALAAGGFGIFSALRQKPATAQAPAPAASPFGTTPDATVPGSAPIAPPAPGTPVAAPPVAPPAAPAPGVVLNGEPVDPNAPRA